MDEVKAAILLAKQLMSDPPGDEAKLLYAGGGYVPGANLPIPELATPEPIQQQDGGFNPLALLGGLAGLAKNASTIGTAIKSATSPEPASTAPFRDEGTGFQPPSNFFVPAKAGDKAFSPPRTFQTAEAESDPVTGLPMPDKGYRPAGIYPAFQSALDKMIAEAPGKLSINSGYRTVDRQRELWERALKKYGSPEIADNWVAPPGRSNHNYGLAADLGYEDPALKDWVHKNAAKYGLKFRMGHEDWHIEPENAMAIRQAIGPLYADGGAVGDYQPQKTVKAYKLFRTKGDGKLYPLFVNATKAVPVGEWLEAEEGPQGKREGSVKSKLGDLAYRPGWHAGDLPVATHIGGKSSPNLKAPDHRPDDQVWAEVEMAADRDWQSEADSRGKGAKAHITDQVPLRGFYRYKTNPNMTGNWLIGGHMKVNRVLSDDEVQRINDAAGVADLPRLSRGTYASGGEVMLDSGGAVLDLDRAKEAQERAGGPAGPASAYMPGVPRQVHAAGGKAAFLAGSKARDFSDRVSSRDTRDNDEFPPLDLHHGTQADFDAFRASGTGTTSFMGIPVEHERHGIFMSESPEMAHGFATQGRRKGKVLKLNAAIKNPLWVHDDGWVHNDDVNNLVKAGVDERWARNHLGGPGTWEAFDGEDGAHFVNALKTAGYDGMTFPEEDPDTGKVHRTWVALHPNQVKSADENEGGYDPDDERFRYAAGGKAAFMAEKHPSVPDVLYHGTKDDFQQFSRKEIAEDQLGFHVGHLDHANHFGDRIHGGNVMPLHAQFKNPLRLKDEGGWSPWTVLKQLVKQGKITEEEAGSVHADILEHDEPENRDAVMVDLLHRLGHDSVVYLNRYEGIKGHVPVDTLRRASDEQFRDMYPEAKDSYIALHPGQLKSAISNNGDYDPMHPDITKAEGGAVDNLARWHADSHPLTKNEDGSPIRLIHGTMGDFSVFSRNNANPESDHGKGFYATNNVSDARHNYAGQGPDMTNKIERVKDQLDSEDDLGEMSPDEMHEHAKERLGIQHDGASMPVYMKMSNPVVLGGPHETHWDYDIDEDGNESGAAFDFIGKLRDNALENYGSPRSVDDVISRLYEHVFDHGGISASDAHNLIKKHQFDSYDEEGNYADNEVWRKTLEDMGHDGVIDTTVSKKFHGMAGMDDQTTHYVAFHPNQIKSATGNRGTYDDSGDITKAEGGAVSIHGMKMVRAGIRTKDDFWQRWQDHLTYGGTPNPGLSQISNTDRVAQQAARLVQVHRADAEKNGIESVLNAYGRVGPNEVVRSKVMHDILNRAGIRPTHVNAVAAYESLPDGDDRMERASGGRITNPVGMYSKAAELARALPQPRGTVDQMMAMLKKAGAKQTELENAGRPDGDVIAREELARHFEKALPPVDVTRYGEVTRIPRHVRDAMETMSELERQHDERFAADPYAEGPGLHHAYPLFTQDEHDRYTRANALIQSFQRQSNQDQTQYGQYTLPGGRAYREHLLTYPSDRKYGHWDQPGVLAHVRMKDRVQKPQISDEDAEAEARRFSQRIGEDWDAVPSDLQAAYIAGAREELEKRQSGTRSLHVEEIQSDWAQKGRKEGFQRPLTREDMDEYAQLHAKRKMAAENHWNTKQTLTSIDKEMKEATKPFFEISKDNADYQSHPDYPDIQAKMKEVFDRRLAASEAHENAKKEFEAADTEWSQHPAFPGNRDRFMEHAPYVTNTQNWVDLALKHVTQEAVKGGYDRVSFSPGEANADHYGMRKLATELHYDPKWGQLSFKGPHQDWLGEVHPSGATIPPEELKSHIGPEITEQLLSQPPVDGVHSLRFDKPTWVGGHGMVNFYNGIVRKAVEKHVKGLDPSVDVGDHYLPSESGGVYKGFSFPITDKMRDTVAGGLPAFADGGAVTPKTNKLGLYSKAAQIARSLPQDKGSVDQMLAMLKKGGVRQTELERAGRPEGDKIDREALAKHFEDRMPNLGVTRMGGRASNYGTKYEQYTIPGGSNYREHLITLQPTPKTPFEMAREMFGREYLSLNGSERTQVVRAIENDPGSNPAGYQSRHWGEPDVVAHVRMKDRVGPNGEKVLHIEEIQSDWGQDARKKGIAEPPDPTKVDDLMKQYEEASQQRQRVSNILSAHIQSGPYEGFSSDEEEKAFTKKYDELTSKYRDAVAETDRLGALYRNAKEGKPGVPPAPYIGNTDQWTQLALKHALQQAVDGDYTHVAVTPGAVQSDRYNLGESGITGLAYDPEEQSLEYRRGREGPRNTGWSAHPDTVPPERLGDYVGPEVARRLLATERHPLSGLHLLENEEDLNVGNPGMMGYYDKIVPKHLRALTGQPVEPMRIDGQTLHSVAIEPETRQTIFNNMTAYQRGGIALERLRKGKTDRT